MRIEKVTVGGIDGNGGREYRVYYSGGYWLSFNSMPGDHQLYCGHTAVGASVDQYATEARELLICQYVGKYNKRLKTLTAAYDWFERNTQTK